MTKYKYLVTYIIKGAFSVEAEDPVKAKNKVKDALADFQGSMETEIAVHYLDEL